MALFRVEIFFFFFFANVSCISGNFWFIILHISTNVFVFYCLLNGSLSPRQHQVFFFFCHQNRHSWKYICKKLEEKPTKNWAKEKYSWKHYVTNKTARKKLLELQLLHDISSFSPFFFSIVFVHRCSSDFKFL